MNSLNMNNLDVNVKQLTDKTKEKALKYAAKAGIPQQLPATNKEWQRVALWSFWAVNMLVDIIYIALSFATTSKLSGHINASFIGVESNTWRAPIAATVLGPLMVIVFNIMSCVILIRKSVNRSGPSFGYGFMMAWCFVMAFYCLLCGLVLDAFTTTALATAATSTTGLPPSWNAYYSQVYQGTIVMNYICCAMFFIFFLAFVIFQGGISKHLQMYDAKTDRKRQLEMAAYARGANQMGGPGNLGTNL